MLVSCWCACGARAAETHPTCQIVDLMPAFWKAIDGADAAEKLRTTVVEAHPDLYNPDYVDVPPGARWEASITRERGYIDEHRGEVEAAERYLQAHVRQYMESFRGSFPDYRCDFVFYIAPSFGRMDGAAAFVRGQHRIIFAPDVIPRYHQLSELKVLIDHETFHIYHHQATGVFGAFPEAVPATIKALWSEGLATYVSWRMNPGVSLDLALLQPGIPDGTGPHLTDIATDLLRHLDVADENTYEHYFVAGRQPQGYPPRAGYYVGFLLAQKLASRYTLPQLASLHGQELRDEIAAELKTISTEPHPQGGTSSGSARSP
jgi:hypothetical protein